jgi:hypothetical protein
MINKWFISRSSDTGKKLPGFVTRHLRSCSGCQKFSRLSGLLAQRLIRDGGVLLRERDDLLNERINSSLGPEPRPIITMKRKPFHIFVPAFAAALFILVVAMGVILQNTHPGPTLPGQNPLTGLSGLVSGNATLPELVRRVESPMESEMSGLKQTVNSAAKFLISCLDIKITP